jgi:hypothetical protein
MFVSHVSTNGFTVSFVALFLKKKELGPMRDYKRYCGGPKTGRKPCERTNHIRLWHSRRMPGDISQISENSDRSPAVNEGEHLNSLNR